MNSLFDGRYHWSLGAPNFAHQVIYLKGLVVNMAWKKIIVSMGQSKDKLTPEEFNKIVKCLEPLKDEFDFEFNTNVKFNTVEI